MKAKDLKDIVNSVNDEEEIKFYVFDYEYDDENPYDVGSAKFIEADNSTIVLGINK